MFFLNKSILIGRLGHDPEEQTFPSGDKIAVINMVTEESWKDKTTDEWKSRPEWHRVIAQKRDAEYVMNNLRKADFAYIEGTKRSRKYTDGQGIERQIVEVIADTVRLHHRHVPKRQDGADPTPSHPSSQPSQDARQEAPVPRRQRHQGQSPDSALPPQGDTDDHPGNYTRW
jgi:single-strand DNA-binding protein